MHDVHAESALDGFSCVWASSVNLIEVKNFGKREGMSAEAYIRQKVNFKHREY